MDKDNYLNEDTLTQGDGSFFDYCAEIDEEERKAQIENLVNSVLPEGMFELTSDDTIVYKGGADKWVKSFVADIHSKAAAITAENAMEWFGTVYRLEQVLKDPLNTCYWFYRDAEGISAYAEQSYDFMQEVCRLEPGTTLYIGGVIDYHF